MSESSCTLQVRRPSRASRPVLTGTTAMTAMTATIALCAALSLAGSVVAGRPTITIEAPAPLDLGDCIDGGRVVTVRGLWIDPEPDTGRLRPPKDLWLEIQPTSGPRGVARPRWLSHPSGERVAWEVRDVPLGEAGGHAVVRAVGVSGSDRKVAVLRAFRVDPDPPRVEIELVGPVACDADAPPPLVNWPVSIRTRVTDSPLAAPPRAELTLDGARVDEGHRIEEDGVHEIVARAIDCAGHATMARCTVVVDRTAPTLVSTTPADGARLTEAPGSFRGRSTRDLAEARVDGRPARVERGGFVLDDFRWREGANEVEVELVDAAGNRTRQEIRFEVRTLP